MRALIVLCIAASVAHAGNYGTQQQLLINTPGASVSINRGTTLNGYGVNRAVVGYLGGNAALNAPGCATGTCTNQGSPGVTFDPNAVQGGCGSVAGGSGVTYTPSQFVPLNSFSGYSVQRQVNFVPFNGVSNYNVQRQVAFDVNQYHHVYNHTVGHFPFVRRVVRAATFPVRRVFFPRRTAVIIRH